MPAPILIEDLLITHLKTLTAVTGIVGVGSAARIRPGTLDQSDTLPAITVLVAEETHEATLDEEYDEDQCDLVRIEVCAIATTHRAARLLQKAIEFNGVIPGTGLNGYHAGQITSCVLENAKRELVELKDDAGGKREVMRLRYVVALGES